MRAVVFHGPGDMRVDTLPDPAVEAPTDAVVRITHACVCGSDLWAFRGEEDYPVGNQIGHEWMGVVEDVGPGVERFRPGQAVIAPFAVSDGSCPACLDAVPTSCTSGGFWGPDFGGGQAEAVRVPFADATLIAIPPEVDGDPVVLRRLLPLTDVVSTGHHAVVCAGVGPGSTVAVVGDGAVGLCAVLAARRAGAERILAVGHHDTRLALARAFGATETFDARSPDLVEAVRASTGGGAAATLECVGSDDGLRLALDLTRPGGAVGYVGMPHATSLDPLDRLWRHNITVRGGPAPARTYIPQLLEDAVRGSLDASAVFDLDVDLAGVPGAYRAMADRTALKAAVTL